MKPKTKLQHEVVRLSEKLSSISKAQQEWAQEHIFDEICYVNATGWCTHCGKVIKNVDKSAKTMICPHCGKELTIREDGKRTEYNKSYFQILTTFGGFQVVRLYLMTRIVRRGQTPEYHADECVQHWINKDGKTEIIARLVQGMSYYWDAWCLGSPMELRNHQGYRLAKYNIDTYNVCPRARLLSELKRNGYDDKIDIGIPRVSMMSMLLTDSLAEQFIKTNRLDMLKMLHTYGDRLRKAWPAIRIAWRHGYDIKDMGMYIDYISMLRDINKDIHSPKYNCPEDFKKAHDWATKKARILMDKKRKEEQIRQASKYEEQYAKDKHRYLDIVFGDNEIDISVLQSVADIAAEGSAMHHCVYTNKYFQNKDSLLMTARDKKQNRLETIELSLKNLIILQSRGIQNSMTPHHDHIIDLVKKNVHLIRKARDKKTA